MARVIGNIAIDANNIRVKVKVENLKMKLWRLKVAAPLFRLGAWIGNFDLILGSEYKKGGQNGNQGT